MDYQKYTEHLQDAIAALDRGIDEILAEATSLHETYRRESTADGVRATYSFRVEKEGNSLRIRWGWFRPIKQPSGEYKIFLRFMTMNKQGTYHESKFKKANAREHALIISCEQQLAILRAEAKKNRAIRSLLSRRITETKKMM